MTDPTPTRDYLSHLFRDLGVVELRHQIGRRWQAGLFDDPDKLLPVARSLARQGNLFTSLNPLTLRPVPNAMGTDPIKNDDVVRYARLFFDFDPVRPADCASTDEELAFAVRAAEHAQMTFTRCGFPIPARAVSGNGAHLMYRTALPNDAETREMLNIVYSGLKRDFTTEHVDFDIKVRNPGRIGPLYGSIKRKGTPTQARPHRQSKIWVPHDWKQVRRCDLEGLAKFYRKQAPPARQPHTSGHTVVNGKGDYRTLDVVAWFQSHGLYKRPADNGKHFVTCPWASEHSSADHPLKTDTVIWESDGGWPSFHCSHSHCEGRDMAAVMALLGDADSHCGQVWRASR